MHISISKSIKSWVSRAGPLVSEVDSELMRIKIWASLDPQTPNIGPYKALDIIERDALYGIGEATHYGPVISLPPFADDDADQSVVVKLNPASLDTRPAESAVEKTPSSYDKVTLFPILVDRYPFPGEEPPPSGACIILEAENLTVEDVSPMIAAETFSVWQHDCMLPKDTIDALNGVFFSIVHRYSAERDRDPEHERQKALC